MINKQRKKKRGKIFTENFEQKNIYKSSEYRGIHP